MPTIGILPMQIAEIRKIAEPIARAALGDRRYRGIAVQEYEDSLGEAAIKIIVRFANAPRGLPAATSNAVDLGISKALREAGERRYPYVDFKLRRERPARMAAE
jgi:hypothetical protein